MPAMRICSVVTLAFLLSASLLAQPLAGDGLHIPFDRKYGQVEVGGTYAGVEFHNSLPLPSRISFYYPVANSVDLSTDYWKRGDSHIITIDDKGGADLRDAGGKEPWEYVVSPHRVTFTHEDGVFSYKLECDMCMHLPAVVIRYTRTNTTAAARACDVRIGISAGLRTCQTYATMEPDSAGLTRSAQGYILSYDSLQTDTCAMIVEDVSGKPVIPGLSLRRSTPTRPQHSRVSFEYTPQIAPGKSWQSVIVMATCTRAEAGKLADTLRASWQAEIAANDAYVKSQTMATYFRTGDSILDRSVIWSKGILAANKHYLNGDVLPMPCPAEYNFFFSHDVLMTDLAAVNFDVARVKHDLTYIASLAKDSIIPHAYYWRDDGYKTEFCTPDNWNHFWFVLTSAAYLRHTFDTATARALYPLLTKSMHEILGQRKADNIMYAFRPDWWDIGHVEGPRSYTTILAIRAVREYLFMNSALGISSPVLAEDEAIADSMQAALPLKLWDEQSQYLINYNAGLKDSHYYMGSLLAAAFHTLDPKRTAELAEAATRHIYLPAIGAMTVSPADFAGDSVRKFFKFVDNEAGDAYTYINGGVWPHTNAWYALALQAAGRTDDAVNVLRRNMTVDGIMNSPNGVPAMYEYRFSDSTSPRFGEIDKPSFMWAGGFYLYTLYRLYGVQESEWNISLVPALPEGCASASFSEAYLGMDSVTIEGGAKLTHGYRDGGKYVPSLVLPLEHGSVIRSMKEDEGKPCLERVNAMLKSAAYSAKENSLTFEVMSFKGHKVEATILARMRPGAVRVDGKSVTPSYEQLANGLVRIAVKTVAAGRAQRIEVKF